MKKPTRKKPATKKAAPNGASQAHGKGASLCHYIRSLTLENVRTFRSGVKLDMCHPDGKLAQWTIILGENGMGKTTLLQYIAGMAPSPWNDVGRGDTSEGRESLHLIPTLGEPGMVSWHFENLSQPRRLPADLKSSVALSKAAETFEGAVPAPESADSDGHNTMNNYGYSIHFEKTGATKARVQIDSSRTDSLSFHTLCPYFAYGASRHVAGSTSPFLSSDAFAEAQRSAINSLFNDDVPLVSPEQWLLNLDYQSKSSVDAANSAKLKASLERAMQCLCGVLPDVNRILIQPGGTDEIVMTVFFLTPYGKVRFSSLSLGYRATAAWIIDFVRKMHLRYPHLEEPEKGPAVVLIDEFDLHMHVSWQMEMMDHLSKSFPNTQFIITAHSPLIVQAADGKANIAVLKRVPNNLGKEEVIIENNPAYVRGWRLDQLVTSDLYGLKSSRSKSHAEMIRTRTVLMQKRSLSPEENKELDTLNERLKQESPPDLTPARAWLQEQLRSAVREVGKRPGKSTARKKKTA